MKNIDIAISKLGLYKLVVVSDYEVVFNSEKNGIVPMYDLYNKRLNGRIYIADRFIGSGAARLILGLKADIIEVFSYIISKDALELLRNKNIVVNYDKIVEKILNRTGDDICPVEKISKNNDDFNIFYDELKEFLIKTNQIEV